MSAPIDKRILLGRDEAGRLQPGVLPASVADRFGFSPVDRLSPNPCYRLPPRPRPMLARRSDLQPSLSPSDSEASSSDSDEHVTPLCGRPYPMAAPHPSFLHTYLEESRRGYIAESQPQQPQQKQAQADDDATTVCADAVSSPPVKGETVDAVSKCSSSTMDASRNNGISARQDPAAFRIAYPHGRCTGLGCHGVCGVACRPEPGVRCQCESSNWPPFPELCLHCKVNDAIRGRAAQPLERVQQRQAIDAE